MKKILICVLVIMSFSTIAGIQLRCSFDEISRNYDGGRDPHIVALTQSILQCYDKKKGQPYTVIFRGVGPGLKFSMAEDMILKCPTVSRKRLARKGRVDFAGVKVGAAIVVGGNVTLAINHVGGTCLVLGSDLGFGEFLNNLTVRN